MRCSSSINRPAEIAFTDTPNSPSAGSGRVRRLIKDSSGSPKAMRILFLAQRVPYPPDRGDKIPTYNQLRHLAELHEVAVACLADGEEDLANVAGLNSLATSVDAVVVRSCHARARALAALGGRTPCTVA